MVATSSVMIELGTKAPEFSLVDTRNNNIVSLKECMGDKGLVVAFVCNHCPYVIHLHDKFVQMAADFAKQGINFVAISSNDAEKYPADSPKEMQLKSQEHNYTFPYLYDETQEVAKTYQAVCTPDFFVFDAEQLLVYRGQFDASRPKNNTVATGEDLEKALNCILEDKEIPSTQIPSLGCNIKWKD